MKDFRDLLVWRRAHDLALNIYRITGNFPVEEKYGLTSQLQRACASIPANLAEGCGRGTDADFARFVQIAMGSASEVEYHLLLAKDLGFMTEGEYETLERGVVEVKRMLSGLLTKRKADH